MNTELAIVEKEDLKDKIYEIRGRKVMLDFDLAKIYGYTTKAFNQQVKNNIERFDNEFRFQLTEKDVNELSRSKNLTLNKKHGRGFNIKYFPYAFTEQGIYMLMTVLKGKKAVEQSKSLILLFKEMKDYIISNNEYNQEFINNLVIKHDNKIIEFDNKFNEIFENYGNKKNKIFFKNQIYDAYSLLLDIFNKSKKEIIIIDNYADKKVLDLVSKIKVDVFIVSKNMDDTLIKKYKEQYNNITIIQKDSFHDRFIIIDKNELYHLGSSIKDVGKYCFGINMIEDKEYINSLINKIDIKKHI
ncbi:MAG: ORF6N domain-containing protein [Bacilli bacterium]|nr:ORF6N domain-containing protein [Bacilli bacterium]